MALTLADGYKVQRFTGGLDKMETNTSFWVVMFVACALIGYGIYDLSLVEIGIGVGLIIFTFVGNLIAEIRGGGPQQKK